MTRWTAADIPDQSGRVAIVTGANSGIGFHAARGLAAKGATVVIAARDADKSRAALAAIRKDGTSGRVETLPLDLADLASVRSFTKQFTKKFPRLDLLVNNAGVMALPYGKTKDGFERQIGTNHLGHFALTAQLYPALKATPDARVVTVSSLMHRRGTLDLDDLHGARAYSRWGAYSQSKLANLMFALELDRRLRDAGAGVLSVAAHPGYAATNLQFAGPQPIVVSAIMRLGNALLAQSAEMGALPTLYAATAPAVAGGDYIGPQGPRQMRGHPTHVRPSRQASDPDRAAALWKLSEKLVDLEFRVDG